MEKTTTIPAAVVKSGGGDKLKRDEWSEGAVSSLLEAYEAKWVLRNRAKLKGHDWEEVSRFVSATAEAPKTQTQCKNKMESMKKRYRSESSAAGSNWPLYERIHQLLNNSGGVVSLDHQPQPISCSPLKASSPASFPTPVNGVVCSATKEEDGAKLSHEKNVTDAYSTDSTSTSPALYNDKGKLRRPSSSNNTTKKKKKQRKKSSGVIIAESVRWVAEAVVRMEKERMEAMKELEKMRAEAEIRRAELELNKTRIIADTQLEIARLLSKGAQSNTLSFQPGTS
ncbi:hypothetical protein QQ045_004000 [Rhodiola kirilowii]